MPKLKGSEISRARGVNLELLPPWLVEQIRRDREDFRCVICDWPMHPLIWDLGWDTHPCCGPYDEPDATMRPGAPRRLPRPGARRPTRVSELSP